jgi:hypothetical protein
MVHLQILTFNCNSHILKKLPTQQTDHPKSNHEENNYRQNSSNACIIIVY